MDVSRRLLVAFFLLLPCAPSFGANRPLLVCFGDSITAGYGLSENQAYPAALQRRLDRLGYAYTVLNRGTSGATTKDAAASVRSIVSLHPAVVVVEFGGNDGLRGIPLDETRRSLEVVIKQLQDARIKVLLAGITLPPNYGPDYIQQFAQVYRGVAVSHHVAFVPMIYKNFLNKDGVLQSDGIHPTARGADIVADTLLPALRPLLRK